MKRDRVLIALILSLGLAAAVFAGWFRWSQGHRSQAYWGVEVAERIRLAKKVELVWLESPILGVIGTTAAGSTVRETITLDGSLWNVVNRSDITAARGLIHARQSLIQDATFRWGQDLGTESTWTHMLVFRDDDTDTVSLLFDLAVPNEGYVREQNATERIQLTIPQGFQTFFGELNSPSQTR